MNIGLTYNTKLIGPSINNKLAEIYAEFDAPEVVEGIKKAIESEGHKVYLIEADQKAYLKLYELKDKLDIIFNVAECFNGEARESQIPAILDMLNIPYTGSGPLVQAITLNKALTKQILILYNIPTPKFQLFHTKKEKLDTDLRFPIIVKPNAEGSSKGIKNDCVVDNEKDAYKKIRSIIKKYKQAAIVEEFLDGKEFTVGIIGNENPIVLPLIEVNFDFLPNDIKKFDSYESKWIYDNPKSGIDPLICPAKIPKELEDKIKETCLKAYQVLRIKDWCRIDLRLDANGVPNILEINAIPGIIPDPKENSRLPRAAYTAGMKYNELVLFVLNAAIKRWNLKNK